MSVKKNLASFWNYLKKDTWHSWMVSIIIIVLIIKFIFFPSLSLISNTPLPLVVVESCSMYHGSDFDSWWDSNAVWYETHNISKSEFSEFSFHNGLNKGDIILVWGRGPISKGDIIIFNAETKYPIIHRLITQFPKTTKGDNGKTNPDYLPGGIEQDIQDQAVIGKAIGRIPFLGWIKLVFFEFSKPKSQRLLCR